MLRTTIAHLFLLFACAQSTAAANYDEVKRASPLQQFAMDPFKESLGYPPIFFSNKSKVLERFGTPIKEESSKDPDRQFDEIMTSYYLQYDGLSFSIIESEDQLHSWIETIEVTGNAHALKYDVGIGSKRSEIVPLFEPSDNYAEANPMRLSASVLGYWANFKDQSGEPRWVNATFDISIDFDASDVVTKISLTPQASH